MPRFACSPTCSARPDQAEPRHAHSRYRRGRPRIGFVTQLSRQIVKITNKDGDFEMRIYLPPLRLTGARTLRQNALRERTVAIENGRIGGGPFPTVNLAGYLILPGIIDLHGTALDRVATRPVVSTALLGRADKMAATFGVTTAWVSHGWDDPANDATALQMVERWARFRGAALTDLRMKVRYEAHSGAAAATLCRAVRIHGIDQVTLGDRVARSIQPNGKLPLALAELAETLDAFGVPYSSLGESDGGVRETLSRIGAQICEFPESEEPALIARSTGHAVVRRASDVLDTLRAKTHGFPCDALASGGDHSALACAAFTLVDRDILPLDAAWALISQRPAEIMALPDRGLIEQRKRADLAIVCERTRVVEATIRGGVLIHAQGEAFERFRHAGVLSSAIAAE